MICYFLFISIIFFSLFFFFFNDTATTEIYTLSLHDALPILTTIARNRFPFGVTHCSPHSDRKSTRLNSSHQLNLVCRLLLEKKKKRAAEMGLWRVAGVKRAPKMRSREG